MAASDGPRDAAGALTVVTACDHGYFAHPANLLASLRRQTAPPERVVIVDVGLSEAERAQMTAAGHSVVRYALFLLCVV